MNSFRKSILKSKAYYFPIFMVVAFVITYLLSSFLGKAKPREQFSIFISGIEFDNSVIKTRLNTLKTEKYDYLLVFETKLADEDDTSAYYRYDYRFENEAVTGCDLIIYSSTFFEKTYPTNAYEGHFMKITEPKTSWIMKNEYAVQVHDKSKPAKDEAIGITFSDNDYYISINKSSVHNSKDSDAAMHFIEAFVHE